LIDEVTGMAMVIVGGGLAGAKAAETLRDEGYDGEVVLVCAEAERPYERPPLSKGYLLGSDERESAFVHPKGWYDENDVEMRLSTRATALDPGAHEVELSDGSRLTYDKLLLTTGSTPRRLDVPGADSDGVLYLRELPDSDRIKAALKSGGRVVIIGAGWIGLEVASAARHHGCDVTVLEVSDLPLQRVLGDEVAKVFADLHREHDVDLRLGTGVDRIESASSGFVVVDSSGAEIEADAVVVGVGIRPAIELAEAAGLAIDDGVAVDAKLQTSAPDVFAAGDVAAAEHPILGTRIRVEHWANALNGGPVAAKSMLGQDVVYDELPFFFTDQYDLGMEYIGHAPPGSYDRVVVRGDLAGREFQAFWLSDGRALAGMHVNMWDDGIDPIKAVVASRRTLDPDRLADAAIPLDQV
jgi:3-phenylpropionate/trans-cinnamate dioxygenase ferredoxin reductase component